MFCRWKYQKSIINNSKNSETISLTADQNGWCCVKGFSYWDQTFISINGNDTFFYQTVGDSDGKISFSDSFPIKKGDTVTIKKPNNPQEREYGIYFYI